MARLMASVGAFRARPADDGNVIDESRQEAQAPLVPPSVGEGWGENTAAADHDAAQASVRCERCSSVSWASPGAASLGGVLGV